jgi:hypothetical protein
LDPAWPCAARPSTLGSVKIAKSSDTQRYHWFTFLSHDRVVVATPNQHSGVMMDQFTGGLVRSGFAGCQTWGKACTA